MKRFISCCLWTGKTQLGGLAKNVTKIGEVKAAAGEGKTVVGIGLPRSAGELLTVKDWV